MSDTPRTDVLLIAHDMAPTHISLISHARELERELNAANAKIKRLEEAGDGIIWVFCKASVSIRNDRESEALKLWIKARGVKL